jgi:hypothetical protein
MSPYLQEKLAYLGAIDVFAQVPELVSKMLGIAVSRCQAYRTCQQVALAIPEIELNQPGDALKSIESDAENEVYGMVDGSMLFTDDGWQETKLGRVFSATPLLEKDADNQTVKWEMAESEYVAQRGHYEVFTQQFEEKLPPGSPCKKIFITDGALWIANWLSESYPDSPHILDFFHVCEKLAEVAPPKDDTWLARQKDALLNDRYDEVMQAIKSLPEKEEKVGILGYLTRNKDRMQYARYRRENWMIGSGPIESAHKTVLQVRMKRSGQRWVNKGCDNVIRLRVAYKSNKFDLVKELLKQAA